MNEAEPAVSSAGTNDRWRLDGRVALVTGASAASAAGGRAGERDAVGA